MGRDFVLSPRTANSLPERGCPGILELMFILLPLGHDKEITHFPYVTLGIVVICTMVQVYSCSVPEVDETDKKNLELEQQLRSRIWLDKGVPWAEEHLTVDSKNPPDSAGKVMAALQRRRMAYRTFFEEYEAGDVVSADDPDFVQLKRLEEERHRLRWPMTLGFRMKDLGSNILSLISYTLVHDGWFHLVGNMLFLYICGCNTEDRWGRGVWLLLYLGGGVVAALTFGLLHPETNSALIGASGAVAAAMGAFLVLNYKANIHFFYFYIFFVYFRFGTFHMRAFWAFPIWLAIQIFGVYFWESEVIVVAYSSHVAGFIMGATAALIFKFTGTDRKLAVNSEKRATLYSQHAAFSKGMDLLERKDRLGARECFEEAVQDEPDNGEALSHLAALVDSPERSAHLASDAVLALRKTGDRLAPRSVFIEHQKRHPGQAMSDRALFAVAECFQTDAPREAISVYEVLLSQHGESVMAPKAMLNMAEIYARGLNNATAARKVLAAVQARYPGTAFADRATLLEMDL